MGINFGKEAIQEYFDDYIANTDDDVIKENWEDLHHHVYNMDYFIIGRNNAKEFLSDCWDEAITLIRDYEIDNFGEVHTDLTEPESIVNMYAYIIGEDIVEDFKKANQKRYFGEVS